MMQSRTASYVTTSGSSVAPWIPQWAQPIPYPTVAPIKKEDTSMMSHVKEYIGRHKDMIFTLGLILLVDHLFFKGAMRNKIQTTLEGLVHKAGEKLSKEE